MWQRKEGYVESEKLRLTAQVFCDSVSSVAAQMTEEQREEVEVYSNTIFTSNVQAVYRDSSIFICHAVFMAGERERSEDEDTDV